MFQHHRFLGHSISLFGLATVPSFAWMYWTQNFTKFRSNHFQRFLIFYLAFLEVVEILLHCLHRLPSRWCILRKEALLASRPHFNICAIGVLSTDNYTNGIVIYPIGSDCRSRKDCFDAELCCGVLLVPPICKENKVWCSVKAIFFIWRQRTCMRYLPQLRLCGVISDDKHRSVSSEYNIDALTRDDLLDAYICNNEAGVRHSSYASCLSTTSNGRLLMGFRVGRALAAREEVAQCWFHLNVICWVFMKQTVGKCWQTYCEEHARKKLKNCPSTY